MKFGNARYERLIEWQRLGRNSLLAQLAILVLLSFTPVNSSIGHTSFATGWNLNRGHNGEVLDVAVSLNGKFGVTTSKDHSLKIWDLETQRIFADITGLNSPVSAIAFASDNIHFVTGDMSGRIFIRSIKSPEKAALIGSIATNEKAALSSHVTDIVWHPTENTVIASGLGTSYAVWKIPNLDTSNKIAIDQQPPTKRLDGPTLFAKRHLSISGDGKRIAFHHQRGEIQIVSWPDLAAVKTIKIRSGMNSTAFSLNHNGTKFVAGSADRITVWDLTGAVATKSVKAVNKSVSVGFLSGDSAVWSCGSPDIWSLPDVKLKHCFATKKQKRTVFTAACSTKDNLLLAGNKYGDVVLMRIDESPAVLTSWQCIGSTLNRIEFSNDGRTMLLGRKTRDANNYPQTQSTVFRLTSDGGPAMNKHGKWHLSPSGQRVCNAESNLEDAGLPWADVSDGALGGPLNPKLNRRRANAAFAAPVCFLPSGDSIVGDSQFPLAKQEKIARYFEPDDGSNVTANATTRDGKILATGHGGRLGFQDFTVGKAALYDLATGKLIKNKQFNFSQVRYVNFSPSGSLAFLGMLDNSLIIDLANGEIIKRIPQAGFGFFQSENSVIIYGSSNSITTVDLANGDAPKQLRSNLSRSNINGQLNPHSMNALKCDDTRELLSMHDPYRRISDIRDSKSGETVGALPKNIRRGVFLCAKTKQIFVNNGLGNSPERIDIFDFENNKTGSLKTLPIGNLKAVSNDGELLLYAEATSKPAMVPGPWTYAIYDSKSGERMRELGKFDLAYVATFSPDDRHVALRPGRQFQLNDIDSKIRILNSATGKTISTIRCGAWHLPDLCFSPDGEKLLLAANISPESLRRFGEWTNMEKLPAPPKKVREVQELTRSWAAVKLWNTETRQKLGEITGHESPINSIQFSRDGTTLLAESRSRATLWAVDSGKTLIEFESEKASLPLLLKRHAPVKFDRELNQIYALRKDKIEVFSGRSGDKLFEMDSLDGFHRGQFIAKNQFLALDTATARLFDFSNVVDPKLTASFRSDSPIISAKQRPSFSQIATVHADATVRFWNIKNGKEIIRFQSFGDAKKWIAFNESGQFTGSDGIEDLLSPATLQAKNASKEIIANSRNEQILESLGSGF